jgi:two-component system response regulator (stage 0 sporulation protein A)
MIKDRAKDVLIKMGMPSSILGFKYIPDVMELFEAGYENAKITALYVDIGKKHNSTGSRVERAIRHAFEGVVTNGQRDIVEKYLSFDNTTNSNMLKLLYYRLKQEEKEISNLKLEMSKKTVQESGEYQKALQLLENDLVLAVRKFIKNIREVGTDVCSKVD